MGEQRELLPGIPDHITLAQIAPKLPWTTFHMLSSVSRCWQKAIQTHEVYEARVRANSTETLVVHVHSHGNTGALALYSTRHKCCHELPPIPQLENRIPRSCQCIALDGKLYVLGGEHPDFDFGAVGTAGVFVFDVAGQRKWSHCASMEEPRHKFGCGVVQGKIFVFGGTSDNQPVLGSEVFDPEQNSWSPRMPMPSWRCEHQVATVGNELFVYGGLFYDRQFFYESFVLDVYDPAEDDWRLLEPFGRTALPGGGSLAMAEGKLYLMTEAQIDVYDCENDSWTNQYTNCFPRAGPNDSVSVVPTASFAVNDEVVLAAHWFNTDSAAHGTYLFQSKGFATKRTELEWQAISCPVPLEVCSCQVSSGGMKCPIQL